MQQATCRRWRSLALAAVVAFLVATPVPAGAQTPATGAVVVVHGLRGRLVDIYLDGKLALKAFEPDRLTDPIDVPAGDHQVDLRDPGTAPDSKPFASATITVTGGAEQSVLAHLSASGKPMISEYDDPVTAVDAGESDVIVRHGAEAPPIDVLFGSDQVVKGLTNSKEAQTRVPAADYQVTVEDASGKTLVPANPVDLESASRMILYLVGSEDGSSLKWLAQPTRLAIAPSSGGPTAQAVPTAVAAGNSGLASPERAVPLLVVVGLIATMVLTAPRRRRS